MVCIPANIEHPQVDVRRKDSAATHCGFGNVWDPFVVRRAKPKGIASRGNYLPANEDGQPGQRLFNLEGQHQVLAWLSSFDGDLRSGAPYLLLLSE